MYTTLPSQYLSPSHPPTAATDFIGPAHGCAVRLERIIASCLANGFPPLKVFYGGPSGVGKTALVSYAQRLLQVHRFALYEFNGTDVNVDAVRELTATLGLSHNEMFGLYRLITIHEADRMSEAAQVKILTLLDNLPQRTAVLCTTNKPVGDMETRFQGRFKYTEVHAPTAAEISALIQRWGVPAATANMIATGAAGSVRIAMNEAEEWLQTEAPTAAITTPPPPIRAQQTALMAA